jgi:tRNA threonylcarbamoyl adenosine modification protein YjeE
LFRAQLAELEIATAEQMHDFGRGLASQLRAGDLVILTGPLGAGKTSLTRGLGEGLGVIGSVTSPTFVIARTHRRSAGGPDLVHVDAYRLSSPFELDDLDIDFENSIVVVEWGQGFFDAETQQLLEIELERDETGKTEVRQLLATGFGERWQGNSWPTSEWVS